MSVSPRVRYIVALRWQGAAWLRSAMRHRLRVRPTAVLLAVVAVALPCAAVDAATTRHCRSADLRYPFQPGGPKTFGVFKLRITGASCTTAHRVAKRWMTRFEADLRQGRVKLPRSVLGFTFKTLPPTAAQTYNERGIRDKATLRFDYVVPNG
jgi:hypothetical protein